MSRTVELRRHTDHAHDVLTPEGVRAALEIGAALAGPYDVVICSGAHRAAQTAACFLAGMGRRVAGGVVVDKGFWSDEMARWLEITHAAKGGDADSLRAVDEAFVDAEAKRLGDALRSVFGSLPDGGRALVVGHTPWQELAVYGVTGTAIPALAKGAGVVVTQDNDKLTVEVL